MAKLRFTEGATNLAKEQISAVQWPTDVIPILSLRWSSGEKDLRRTQNGEAIWSTSVPAGWVCDIASWVIVPDRNVDEHTTVVGDGIRVLLDPKASIADGTFHIEEKAGGFNVTLRAA